jgi:hypothetical protein
MNLKNLKQNLKNEEATPSKKSDFSFEEGVAKLYIDLKCSERAKNIFLLIIYANCQYLLFQ